MYPLLGAILIVSGATLISALPNKVYGATIEHYAGQVNTTAHGEDFRAYFTAPSNIASMQYAFWYVSPTLNCATAKDQFQIRKVSDNGLVALWNDSSCVDVASGTLRVGAPNYNNATSGVAYYAQGGFNIDRPRIGNGVLDFNFVLSTSTTTPPAPTDPSIGGTRVIDGTFSPADYSTTTSAVPIAFDYFVDTLDVTGVPGGGLVGLFYTQMCVELQSMTVLPSRTVVCDSFDVGQLGTFSTTTPPMADGPVIANVYLQSIYDTKLYIANGAYQFAVSGYDTAQEIFNQSYGSSTVNTALLGEKCSPVTNNVATLYLNTSFSPLNCLSILFIPSQGKIGNLVSYVATQSLLVFPFGYVTDFVSIISTSTVGTLPTLSATVPSVLPGAGATISLPLTNVFDSLLYATSGPFTSGSATSTDTFYDITSYYWEIVLYILALLYMISRIVGTHLISVNHFGPNGALSDNGSNDDSYRLKEYLYKHRKK